MSEKISSLPFSLCFILMIFCSSWAQGPTVSYYYNSATELSWAKCYLHLQGGSRLKLPFLPVINRILRAPTGTKKYSKDIDVNDLIVFAGNGIVKENEWNSYWGRKSDFTEGEIDVAGKIVMFCYDFPDSMNKKFKQDITYEHRISEAANRKATAVVLFSFEQDYPFLYVRDQKEMDIDYIPVITITKNSAADIFTSAGINAESFFAEWQESGKTKSMALISSLELKIKGNFDKVSTDNLSLNFRKELISEVEMKKLASMNEMSIDFLLDYFKELQQLKWKKMFILYFRDYDSKLFYTHHWGKGMAGDAGVFMVYEKGVLDYGLAVHENTHILAGLNWGGSTSFMDEGLGKFTEALVTDKDKNHRTTIKFLREKKLFPLKEMLEFNIGKKGLKTDVGYPASGSFIGFLADNYGLKSIKDVYIFEKRSKEEKLKKSSWEEVYKKSLTDLEKEWHDWLHGKF